LRVDPEVEKAQVEALQTLRANRDNRLVETALTRLGEAARSDGNLMPPILDAVRAYATLGEICRVLRDLFGEYRDKG